jgi:antitoxin component YwqK of YwqJK toxin-antitoxin module
MKKLLVFVLLAVLVSCSGETDKPKKKVEAQPEELVEIKDGIYTEWYPGKKQVKFKGPQDEQKRRNGIWYFYSEGGQELSVTMYEHGLRTGYSLVKYPTGVLHYRGEYANDKMVGVWTTYDESGKMVSEILYDKEGKIISQKTAEETK